MPFRKYRSLTQFGRHDTTAFKRYAIKQNEQLMPVFELPQAVKNLGVRVYESGDPELFSRQMVVDERRKTEEDLKALFRSYEPERSNKPVTRDFASTHRTPAYVFESEEPMCDGVAQASILCNAVVREQLPDGLLDKVATFDVDEQSVRDSILHGERYDPSLDRLPKRHDPVIFWIYHFPVFGTPVVKRGNIILSNLLRRIYFAGRREEKLADFETVRDPWLTSITHSPTLFGNRPFVLRFRPHLVVRTREKAERLSSTAWLSDEAVGKASQESLPNIYPLSPLIDLQSQNYYHDFQETKQMLIGTTKEDIRKIDSQFVSADKKLALSEEELEKAFTKTAERRLKDKYHAALWCREQDQKYPWTTEQNAANAMLHTYGLALTEVARKYNSQEEAEEALKKEPIMVRGAQLVDGRFDLVAIQLNTTKHEEDRRNIIWLQRAQHLYQPKPYYEELKELNEVNMETVKKLTALLAANPH